MVVFDRVSKKFRRGERHNSLRDLVPSLVRRAIRPPAPDHLGHEEFWAVRDVSFSVTRGEALGIIGPNGAGKSTTLKLLTRILKPTTGRCALRGRVGALIEVAAGFHPELTGRENVFLQGAIMGMKRAEISARFDEIVDFAGGGEFIDTPVKRYSSGMNARLGFSIAAHLHPDVLVIDEVLSVGDIAFQQRCVERMKGFLREGVTIVFVSHNLESITGLCRQALYLNRSVRALGATSQVIDSYLRDLAGGNIAAAEGPVHITNCELTDARGTHAVIVASGTCVTLRVCYRAVVEVNDFTLGFVLRRSTDHLLVYDGNVPSEELPCGTLIPGQSLTIDFRFRTNLARGHYHVELYVLHNPKQQFLARLSPATSFTVEETRTCAGVANVDLEPCVVDTAVV